MSLSVQWGRKFLAVFTFTWLLIVPPGAVAGELHPETLKAWDEYIQAADARTQERLRNGSFLWVDESAERSRQVRAGKILVSPAVAETPKPIPAGLIHDWMGATFIPQATMDDVLAVLRDYDNYKVVYKPSVADSKALASAGEEDRFSMLLVNRHLAAKMALATEYQVNYQQLGNKRWYSAALTTRVQEVRNYGRPDEQELRPDEGSGYIWRLYSFSRFEERDGGVYIEVEALALSRDIPAAVRWLVNPIVRSVSKNSVLTSLRQTEEAVRSEATVPRRAPRERWQTIDSSSPAIALKR